MNAGCRSASAAAVMVIDLKAHSSRAITTGGVLVQGPSRGVIESLPEKQSRSFATTTEIIFDISGTLAILQKFATKIPPRAAQHKFGSVNQKLPVACRLLFGHKNILTFITNALQH